MDLDLAVLTAEEFDDALDIPTAPVAGAVQTLAGARMDEELMRGDPGGGIVSLSQASTGEVNLAVHAGAAFTQILVEDVDRLVCQGPAIGHGYPCR